MYLGSTNISFANAPYTASFVLRMHKLYLLVKVVTIAKE